MSYEMYPLVCRGCGCGNTIARDRKFAPHSGGVVLDWCWTCMEHVEHDVAPEGCLVVWGMIRIVNKKTWKGEGQYIGRPSPLGNPFEIGRDGTRDEVIEKYRVWLEGQMDSDTPAMRHFMVLLGEYEREGKLVLECWCKPERCHGEIIKEFIEAVAHRG